MKALTLLLVLVLLPAAIGDAYYLRDISTNEPIDNVAVYLTEGNIAHHYYVTTGGQLDTGEMVLPAKFEIRADKYGTKGNDYYIKDSLPSYGLIYLTPVGSVKGVVKDSLENVVPYAKLKFNCGNFDFPPTTDEFGSFFIDYAPAGYCNVDAQYLDSTGSSQIVIEKGMLVDAEIILDKSIVKKKNSFDLFPVAAFSLIVVFLILAILIARKMKKKPAEKEAFKEKQVVDMPKKIMETLDKKEREVVQLIIDNNNCMMQASIRHTLSIPRTTLSRIIESLQRKKIVNVEKVGKSVKIRLTDFFLGKE
ncbi:hypothetical protein J4401_06880 [Candidatus Woesearchaeota archaeon]|nr:hypothetical protein [Candidatus Woesearchaeota archaeon]